jgi:hypothetical protein
LCLPSCLGWAGWTRRSLGVLSALRLRLWPPSTARSNPAATPRALTMRATVPGSIACQPTMWVGDQPGGGFVGRGVVQSRRNTSPAAMPVRQRASARTGQGSLTPYGMPTYTPLRARSPLETGRVMRSPCLHASRWSTAMPASSLRRNAPAKPTSSSVRSRSSGDRRRSTRGSRAAQRSGRRAWSAVRRRPRARCGRARHRSR